MKDNYYDFFKEKLLDISDEKNCFDREIEETLKLLRQKIAQVRKLEKKLKKQKEKSNNKKVLNRVELKKTLYKALKLVKKIGKKVVKKIIKTFTKKRLNVTKKVLGVSVIIPTYKKNDYIHKAIESVINQKILDYELELIIAVNGDDYEYFTYLSNRYYSNDKIKVVYTKIKGASAGRNLGVDESSFDYILFLDDDDYLSEGYINELVTLCNNKTAFVCGCLADFNEETYETDNYINRAISTYNKSKSKKYKHSFIGLFSNVAGKLLNKKMFDNGIVFNETFCNTEDVIFWSENYDDIRGKIACCDVTCGEYYYRRVKNGSLSRPVIDDEFKFYIIDRIKVIQYIENLIFNTANKYVYQVFLLKLINAQTNIMKEFYNKTSEDVKCRIYDAIKKYEGFLINKGLFSKFNAIAFCYNFPPAVDTSAYVAIKRLRQINAVEDKEFNWTAVSKDTSDIYKNDDTFDMFYAKFLYNQQFFVGGRSSYNSKEQYYFAKIANRRVSHLDADLIYSRSMAPASHLAAYMYKCEHPNVKWYAEFSDPVYMTSKLTPRSPSSIGEYANEEKHLNDLFEMCEVLAYENADHIIFTNQNQKDYMLDYNKRKDLTTIISEKSLVWRHPIIEKPYVSLIEPKYKLDETKINVGYFGRFYENRSENEILKLLDNDDVVLHLFVLKPKKVEYLDSDRIKVNEAQPYLSFINLASKMDYVFLNDMVTENGINPWLPSKISDYLASGSKIIGKYVDGSPLSKLTEKQIIKVNDINKQFIDSLVKQNI